MIRSLRAGAIALFVVVGIPAASAQTAAELTVRVDRLEALVRTLTGQIDELTHQVQVLQDTIQRMQADYEYRFQRLEGGAGTAPAATAPPIAAPAADPLQLGAPPAALGLVPADPAAAGVGAPLDLGQVLRGDGTYNLTPPATVPGADVPMDAPPAGVQTAALTGNAQADYDRFYQFILNGDDVAAEQGFRAFLSAYPGNARTVDAQYWLAESLFSQATAPGAATTLYVDAANAYLTAYRSSPQGDKAPDALFKLGMSMVALGRPQDGCDIYAQVLATYPAASNALRERVAAEQRNARCG
ncbi:MAG: tetratricopeptide repeat protein [Bauldia sp.]|nr:tetratricopeptide repeat protein [Bauldia sp.]